MRKILSHPERPIFLYTKTARPPTFARDGLAKFSHTKRNVQISLSRLFSTKTLQSNKFVRYCDEKEDTKKKDQSISYQLSGIENKNIFLVAIFSYNSFFWRKRFAERPHLAPLFYSKIFSRNQDFYVFVDLLRNRILLFYLCNFWGLVNGTLNQAQLCIQEIFSRLKGSFRVTAFAAELYRWWPTSIETNL